MRKKYISLLLSAALLMGLCAGFTPAAWAAGVDITEKFTDPNFRAAVYRVIEKSPGDPIYDIDVADVWALDEMRGNLVGRGIKSLAGLEYFTGLHWLDCYDNELTSLPEILPSSLTSLSCGDNLLTELPATLPEGLTSLSCGYNSLTELPEILPSGLISLICSDNNLITLPRILPSDLTRLWCDSNQLTSLPVLPSGLEELYCDINQLTSLPKLPSGLEELSCWGNELILLPVLPSGLTILDCSFNELTTLPILPTGLATLECDGNQLASLPILPSGLTVLQCYNNQLTSLPVLPSGLTALHCQTNQLTSLPELPSSLEHLYCDSNQLTSLPALPSGLQWLTCDDNDLTSLPKLPSEMQGFICSNNMLTGLDVTGFDFSKLFILDCSHNNITSPTAVIGFTPIWDDTYYKYNPQNVTPDPLDGLSEWAISEANALNARGVIPPDLQNNFQKPIHRDEFVALLVNIYANAMGFEMFPGEYFGPVTPFSDIGGTSYIDAINIAYIRGLIDGTSPTKFTPDGLLTREQTAKLLYTLVDKIDGAELGNGSPDFTDSAAISAWARPYVAWCQQNGVMQGSNGNFKPQGNLTREEAMLVCERLIVRYGW